MALNHGIITDTDPHFIIDPKTRRINTTSDKVTLVQGDKNSERFTFEVPLEIEGHQMELTDKVEVHFINIDQMTKATSKGLYKVEDVEVEDVEVEPADEENPARVTFSWLIDSDATKYQGVLNFVVRFVCMDGAAVLYSWSTTIYTGITVTDGINNDGAIASEYNSILEGWKQELQANQIVDVEEPDYNAADGAENVWTVKFGDGRTREIRVRNGATGARGETGLVGSIETVNKKPLHFFTGDTEEYNNYMDEEEQPAGMLAIVDDDTTVDDLMKDIEGLQADMEGIKNGTEAVGKADAITYGRALVENIAEPYGGYMSNFDSVKFFHKSSGQLFSVNLRDESDTENPKLYALGTFRLAGTDIIYTSTFHMSDGNAYFIGFGRVNDNDKDPIPFTNSDGESDSWVARWAMLTKVGASGVVTNDKYLLSIKPLTPKYQKT